MLTFGSLFTGFGGLDLGLERAGLVCKWQVEVNRYARQVLQHHWPNVARHDDVCTFPEEFTGDLDVDAIVGGDPCQENSNARQGVATTAPSLGHEFVRVLDIVRPRYFLRENPSRVRPDAPWPWWRFRSATEALGYVVLPFRLRACCVGADHRRERLFLLGELSNPLQAGLQRPEFQKMEREARRKSFLHAPRQTGWDASSKICRASDGIPDRVERLIGGGNAVYVGAGEYIGRQIIAAMQRE